MFGRAFIDNNVEGIKYDEKNDVVTIGEGYDKIVLDIEHKYPLFAVDTGKRKEADYYRYKVCEAVKKYYNSLFTINMFNSEVITKKVEKISISIAPDAVNNFLDCYGVINVNPSGLSHMIDRISYETNRENLEIEGKVAESLLEYSRQLVGGEIKYSCVIDSSVLSRSSYIAPIDALGTSDMVMEKAKVVVSVGIDPDYNNDEIVIRSVVGIVKRITEDRDTEARVETSSLNISIRGDHVDVTDERKFLMDDPIMVEVGKRPVFGVVINVPTANFYKNDLKNSFQAWAGDIGGNVLSNKYQVVPVFVPLGVSNQCFGFRAVEEEVVDIVNTGTTTEILPELREELLITEPEEGGEGEVEPIGGTGGEEGKAEGKKTGDKVLKKEGKEPVEIKSDKEWSRDLLTVRKT